MNKLKKIISLFVLVTFLCQGGYIVLSKAKNKTSIIFELEDCEKNPEDDRESKEKVFENCGDGVDCSFSLAAVIESLFEVVFETCKVSFFSLTKNLFYILFHNLKIPC